MAETPERDASEIVAGWLALFMPYETKPTVTLRRVLEARIADALRAERERAERAEAALRECQESHGSTYGMDWRNWRLAQDEVERLTKVPQVVDFLVQHHTLIRLRDTLRSLAEQADSAIHDAVEPSRLADIERDRDGLTREVERLRKALYKSARAYHHEHGMPRRPNEYYVCLGVPIEVCESPDCQDAQAALTSSAPEEG